MTPTFSDQGPPLRGGFSCALPGAALRVTCSARPDFRRELCAPPLLTWMPQGRHLIRPSGLVGYNLVSVTEQLAEVANEHLQELRAQAARGEGQMPFLDLDHDGVTILAEVTDLFWAPNCGIMAAAEWTSLGEKMVLEGALRSFSPTWTSIDGAFAGLTASLGALLSASNVPGFTVLLGQVQPVTGLTALRLKSEHFIRSIDKRRRAACAGHEFPALAAFQQVAAERPGLHSAYTLAQAIHEQEPAELETAMQ